MRRPAYSFRARTWAPFSVSSPVQILGQEAPGNRNMSDDTSSRSSDSAITLELAAEPEEGADSGGSADQHLARIRDRWWPRFAPVFRRLWEAEAPGRAGEIAVVLVGTSRIHQLNLQFLDRDRPTDVLSFDLSDHHENVEGEVYICMDVAAAQAERAGVPLHEETARLMVHGLLHLAGHDHHSPADGRRMAKATRKWLGELFPSDELPSPDPQQGASS